MFSPKQKQNDENLVLKTKKLLNRGGAEKKSVDNHFTSAENLTKVALKSVEE